MNYKNGDLVRDFVTPATIILFLVSTVTGLMLLLHLSGGLVKFSHEWLSVGFAAVAIWHLARNWRSFTLYLKRNGALATLSLMLISSLAFTALTGQTGGGGPRAVFSSLSLAPLEKVAPAFGLTVEEAINRLEARGYRADRSDNLKTIGARAGSHGPDVLFLLVQNNTRESDGR